MLRKSQEMCLQLKAHNIVVHNTYSDDPFLISNKPEKENDLSLSIYPMILKNQ